MKVVGHLYISFIKELSWDSAWHVYPRLTWQTSNRHTSTVEIILSELIAWALPVKLVSDECHRTLLILNQHWLRKWLIRRQAITWANVKSQQPRSSTQAGLILSMVIREPGQGATNSSPRRSLPIRWVWVPPYWRIFFIYTVILCVTFRHLGRK